MSLDAELEMVSAPVAPSVEAAEFRAAMAAVATPVTVVTSLDHGRPHGTTVSAFASLSLDPPMVVVALDRSSSLLAMVRRTRRVGVNVLAEDQHELALRFARRGADGFAGTAWTTEAGLPRLAAASAWLAAEVEELVGGGDHVLLMARVTAADADPDRAPLTYHRQRFGTHRPHAL